MDPRTIPWAIIEKYATRGPRYTSYPTAPHFREGFDASMIEAQWGAPGGDDDPGLSAYVHVPFCRRRCLYCGCHTEVLHPDDDAELGRYIDGLLRELAIARRLLADDRGPLRQLALGGGTPTLLPANQMARLLDALDAAWPAADDAERSVEVDPRTADPALLALLGARGFNRFSLGVQTLDPEVQRIVGREQPLEVIEALMATLRAGDAPPAINLDLIQGLPGQDPASFAATVAEVARLRPERIAVFGYAHVPWMRPHQQALEGYPLPDARDRVEMLGLAWQGFVDAGYVPIGFDHFALPDDELAAALAAGTLHRNFMGYTTRRGLDLIGLGVSAIGAVGRTYTQDAKGDDAWRRALVDGRMPWEKAFLLSDEDLVRRDVILDLSCNLRLDFARFRERYDVDARDWFPAEMEALGPLADDGLLTVDDAGIRVTDLGRFLVRNVCMVFDQYLGQRPDGDAPPRYSRTV